MSSQILFVRVYPKHHTWCIEEEKKMPTFPHASNQWGEWEMENVKGSQPQGWKIIPQLLPGIWCINTALEKHYSKAEGLHYCTTQSFEIPIDRGRTSTMNMTICVI